MDTVWISLAVPSVLAVQAPASGTGLNSLSIHGSALELRWGAALLVVVGPPPTKERWNSLSRWSRYMCTNVHGKKPWNMPRHRVWSTCLWQRLSRSTTPSRSTMALCQPPNILTTTQDLHPGTAAFTMLRSTCCGALRQESWHTRRLLHGDVCTPYTQGSHQCVPWLGQSFQQKRLSQPDVPGWTCVHVPRYGAWIAASAQDPRQLDANSSALQLYQWVHLDPTCAFECAYSDQQARHWPSTCWPFIESVPLWYGTGMTHADDLQRALLHYTAQFTVHLKRQFNEAENLGSQQMRDKVAAMAAAPATTATWTTFAAMDTAADETTAENPWSTGTESWGELQLVKRCWYMMLIHASSWCRFCTLYLDSTPQYMYAFTLGPQGTVRPKLGVHTSWLRL